MADEKARESGGEITGTSRSFLANELVDNSAKEYALRELCQELIKSTLDGIQESASYSITVATDQGQGTTNVYGHRQGSSKSSFQLQMTSMGASAYLEKHKVIELLKV